MSSSFPDPSQQPETQKLARTARFFLHGIGCAIVTLLGLIALGVLLFVGGCAMFVDQAGREIQRIDAEVKKTADDAQRSAAEIQRKMPVLVPPPPVQQPAKPAGEAYKIDENGNRIKIY